MFKLLILLGLFSTQLLAKEFSFGVSTSTVSNLKMNSNSEHFSTTSISLNSGYKNFSASISGNKSLVGERKFNLGNFVLGYRYPSNFKFGKWKGGISSRFILPTSKNSRKVSFLALGTQHTASISRSLSILKKTANFSFYTSVGLNFHEYKTNLNGGSNHQQTYTIGGNLYVSLLKNLGLSLSGSTTKLITYELNDLDTYSLGQSLSTSLMGLNISIGHYLGGSLLSPNGTDLGVRFFDNERSNIYVNLGYQF